MSDLRAILLDIRKDYGNLTPRTVVEAAIPQDHPLHNRFEWDDTTAADKYRVHQAHELIQSVRITYRSDGERRSDIRAFHAVRREQGHVYEPAEEIANDEFATQLVLQEMQRQWEDMKRRYGHFAEFVEMIHGDLGEQAA